MRKIFVVATLVALAAGGTATIASAQGKSGGHQGASSSESRALDRADVAAGRHGTRGRVVARRHGANAQAFCPPGQAKNPAAAAASSAER